MTTAPLSENELLQRCENITGLTLGELAAQLGITPPENLQHHKGWIGQLLEQILGATAKSKAEPDFELIGVELKTLPLNLQHQPKESTFVCTATPPFADKWQDSLVWKKLRRVLWIPIEATRDIAIKDRKIGQAILWTPSEQQAEVLQQDWSELTEMLTIGHYADLTAKHGTYLQCRPKAAHSKITRNDVNHEGHAEKIIPRGFYLRTCFTQQIIESAYKLPKTST
jgi:DNA mismatch repair protein MutH